MDTFEFSLTKMLLIAPGEPFENEICMLKMTERIEQTVKMMDPDGLPKKMFLGMNPNYMYSNWKSPCLVFELLQWAISQGKQGSSKERNKLQAADELFSLSSESWWR